MPANMKTGDNQVVFTNQARCRDCYRCVRVCPVKAIRLQGGQAQVVQERCVACGTCVRECPQGAKNVRDDIMVARELIADDQPVIASVAPSFAGIYESWQLQRLPSALRLLGFDRVEETAIGAWHSARRTAEHVRNDQDRQHIGSACPAVVAWIEHYHPDHVEDLVPVLSPMRTHAAIIRREHGNDARVIFIGPCVAKKHEADQSHGESLVNCALTFAELQAWIEDEGINLESCEETAFDGVPGTDARFYPVEGGSLHTSEMTTDLLAREVLAVSGIEQVREILSGDGTGATRFVEPLFCADGCVGGPAVPDTADVSRQARRQNVLAYATDQPGEMPPDTADSITLQFDKQRALNQAQYSESRIRAVLEKTGKSAPEDQLNCGACGYNSCRDQAIAVLDGLAEADMCIPYMRRLAEQRSDRIMETSPNGIIILNEQLMIMRMNPAFRKMFTCTDMVLGRRISYLMDPEPFERLRRDDTSVVETVVQHKSNNLLCQQILYPLPEERQYVGIFVDITSSRHNREELSRLREETIEQANELLEHQIQMAQQMTRVLGENTARGEELVARLKQLAGRETPDDANEEGEETIWDTYTPK